MQPRSQGFSLEGGRGKSLGNEVGPDGTLRLECRLYLCFLDSIHLEYIMNVYSHTGHGNFGSVLKGEYTKGNGEKIPVAVKKLKSEEMNNPKVKC